MSTGSSKSNKKDQQEGLLANGVPFQLTWLNESFELEENKSQKP